MISLAPTRIAARKGRVVGISRQGIRIRLVMAHLVRFMLASQAIFP